MTMKHPLLLLSLLSALGLTLPAGCQPAASPRIHERFDAHWRFHRGDEPDAWREGFDDARWRAVDLPHDWSIEDLPPAESPTVPTLAITPGVWRFHLGDDPAWKSPECDDSGWQELALPAGWKSHVTGNITNTFGWYRRRIPIPSTMRGKDLVLLIGKVDDVDETFVNGVRVGGLGALPPNYSTAWTLSRRYRVPARLLKGDGSDVVAVRVYNGDGDAGIYAAVTPPMRSGPFDSESENGTAQGYTVGGIGWYRKSFTLPAELRGRLLSITFDGVYMNSEVWFNGRRLGSHPYGYTDFSFDLTPLARFGAGRNWLAVRVDASGKTSRWYSGAGIYRHVWLTATDPIHVASWGVAVTTPTVSDAQATIHIHTLLRNDREAAPIAALTSRIVDAKGATVASITTSQSLGAHAARDLDQQLVIAHPALWSPDRPTLYRLVSTVRVAGHVVDEERTPFGIRSVTIDAVYGLLLNGKPLKLRGGCMHHDNGCLGSCAYDRAEERRVELLKNSGYNAIRTSHNPPSPAFLDACDRLGVLVMDEAFDCWKYGKNPNDYHLYFDDWWQRDLAGIILRDRNHPAVILWSIGNEIPGQTSPEGAEIGARLAKVVRSLDPTRPVAQATNPDADKLDPLLASLDVSGYNYAEGRFASDHEKHSARVFAATESFPQSCFDSWMAVLDHPYAIGDFVWTAMDYLGEAGLGKTSPQSTPPGFVDNRLWTVSNCGDFDLSGMKRPPAYYRNVVWGVGAKIACFVQAQGPDGRPERVEGWGWTDERPSWTWPGLEGKPLTVRVYSRYSQARLLLNGSDLGTKPTDRSTRFTATWDVSYAPGTLIAVGLDSQGREMARWTLRTAGKAVMLRLTPDRAALTADGQDLSYVTVQALDSHGVLDPNAEMPVHFTLMGPGKILGVSNGDPRSVESFQQPHRRAFRGRCLVVIKATEQTGEIRLTARAGGLQDAEIRIHTINGQQR